MTQIQIADGHKHAPAGRTLTRAGIMVGLVVISAVIAERFYRSAMNVSEGRAQTSAQRPESTLLIREEARITVPEASPLRNKLTVAVITEKEIQRTLTLPAVVEADPSRTVKVLPPATGRVTDLMVQLGGRVKQGQEIAVIDSGDLAQAYADIEKARSVKTLTKNALDRQLGLEKAGGTAIKDREQAQSDYNQAVAELERAESRLRAMGVPADQKEQSRLLSIKAPVSGSVIDLQVAPGAFLNDATAAIMTIANLDTIWVTANVPEKDTALVTKGQDVDVVFAAYPNETFAGKVLFISDVLDPDTRRTKVRIAFQNPETKLKPNMFANATFLAPKHMAPVVPTSALVLKDESDQLFVEVAPWTFEARTVELGFLQGDQAIIERGLKAGERVVVKGGVLLND